MSGGGASAEVTGYPFDAEYRHDYQQIFTPKQVAAIMQVSERTVEKACAAGKLKAARLGTRWRISRTALDAFLDGGQS